MKTKQKHRKKFIFFRTAALLVFLFCTSQPSFAEGLSCEDLLHVITAAKLSSHQPWRKDADLNPAVISNNLYSKSQAFRNFYHNETQLSKFDPAQVSQKMIADYHRSIYSEFENPNSLEKLRSDSLNQALLAHGASVDASLSGQQNLAQLSRKNVMRILGDYPNKDLEFAAHPEILTTLKEFELKFQRNAHSNDIDGDFILSSQRLSNYTGRGGYQSTHDFNREQLKSDDNIFFFSFWSTNKNSEVLTDKTYGDHTSQVSNQSYALKHGWISFFVMWPEELERLQPPEGNQTTAELVSLLYQFDFTPADFELLVRTLLGRRLISLQNSTERKHRVKFYDLIDDRKLRKLLTYLNEQILQPLHLNTMEFKIPVVLPKDKVSEVEEPSQ